MSRGCDKSRFPVHRFYDLEIGASKQIPQDLPVILLILDHQDALAHDGPLAFRPASEP